MYTNHKLKKSASTGAKQQRNSKSIGKHDSQIIGGQAKNKVPHHKF
jgi:hypothetical protein